MKVNNETNDNEEKWTKNGDKRRKCYREISLKEETERRKEEMKVKRDQIFIYDQSEDMAGGKTGRSRSAIYVV